MAAASPAAASPWVEVGDPQLRSDIELLAAARLIDGITTHWPLPWNGLTRRLTKTSLDRQPAHVREAARRVLARARAETTTEGLRAGANLGLTNQPSVVRGFDARNRDEYEAQAVVEWMGNTTALRLALGAQGDFDDNVRFMPDGSFIAQAIGGAVVYGGYLDHWWGPGWISALSLSNNARPFPHIGIARRDTEPFETPWLSWLGPWQAEFLVGFFDDGREIADVAYNGLRFTFNPLPGLEIGIARTQMLCGEGQRCDPLATYFDFDNKEGEENDTNDQGLIDIRYSLALGDIAFSVYGQLMNEDSNPISHSATSHLVGGSLWGPIGDGAVGRLTVEYSDTIATKDIFGGGRFHGAAYNNSTYVDGMRYRGRSLGHSLDSDSRLFSVQLALTDRRDVTYSLTYHNARISTSEVAAAGGSFNTVSATPETINLVEGRIQKTWGSFAAELAVRLQDDQPAPDDGFVAAVEGNLKVRF